MQNQIKKLGKESLISILSLLKYFYDEEAFNYLAREIYNSDLDISLTAINSSAVIGNEAAIPHLYTIIEKGKPAQKLAAIKALAVIRAPSSTVRLLKYYSLFSENEIRIEIIKTLTAINNPEPVYKTFLSDLILDPHTSLEIQKVLFDAVIALEDKELLLSQKKAASREIEKNLVRKALNLPPKLAAVFFNDLLTALKDLDKEGCGYFLAGYLLYASQPDQKLVISNLTAKRSFSLQYFLEALLETKNDFSQPQRIFKTLIILPYLNQETETLIGKNLEKLINQLKERSALIYNELAAITSAHLEFIVAKIKKNFLSLATVQQKEALIPLLFARLIENYGTPTLLDDTLRFFKGFKGISEEALKADLTKALASATEEEKNQLKASFILFSQSRKPEQMKTLSLLSNVDLSRPSLIRRLNRFVRLAGLLGIKGLVKTLNKILEFAKSEHISFLEETTTVTLCQLCDKIILDKALTVLKYPVDNSASVRGFLRGLRFCEQPLFLKERSELLLKPEITTEIKLRICESFQNLNNKQAQPIIPYLVKALFLPQRHPQLFAEIERLILKLAEGNAFQVMFGFLQHKDQQIRLLAIRALREIVKRDQSLPKDILVNRFYSLLEDSDPQICQEALAALLYLEDDYAVQVLGDYLKEEKINELPALLNRLPAPYPREVIRFFLKQLSCENKILQETLRPILAEAAKSENAEELRNILFALLLKRSGNIIELNPAENSELSSGEIEHAKLEFKFRRENSQILTVFFCDIVSYTEKTSLINTSALMKLIHSFEGIVLPLIKEYRGQVVKTLGDGILAVFKHPLNAVLAALEIQKRVAEYNAFKVAEEKFQLRIGLNTGLVIRKAQDIFGDVVNIASRMQAAAEPGDILLTYETYKEIQNYIKCTPLGRLKIKGKEEAIAAYSVQEAKIDLKHLLKQAGAKTELSKNEKSETIANLKELMFSPNFNLPKEALKGRTLLEQLATFFQNMVTAIEDVTQDYHEEYAFKKYLQEQWDIILKNWDKYLQNNGKKLNQEVASS